MSETPVVITTLSALVRRSDVRVPPRNGIHAMGANTVCEPSRIFDLFTRNGAVMCVVKDGGANGTSGRYKGGRLTWHTQALTLAPRLLGLGRVPGSRPHDLDKSTPL